MTPVTGQNPATQGVRETEGLSFLNGSCAV